MERRCGTEPIPTNLDEMLSEAQRKSLPGIEYSGWELCFFRKRLFFDPEIVMRNRNDNRLCIFEYDGSIRVEADFKIREEDDRTRPTLSNKTPVLEDITGFRLVINQTN
jgi:hypothetical protein